MEYRTARSSKHVEENPEYNHFFAAVFVGLLIIFGVYLANILLCSYAFAGNVVMVNFLGYMLYFVIANPVLVFTWLVVYYFKVAAITSKKRIEQLDPNYSGKATSYWMHLVHTWRCSWEFTFAFSTWLFSSTLAWVLQISFYVFIVVGIPSTSDIVTISDPAAMIGSNGTMGYFEDLFQITNLTVVILYSISLRYFLEMLFSLMAAASQKL